MALSKIERARFCCFLFLCLVLSHSSCSAGSFEPEPNRPPNTNKGHRQLALTRFTPVKYEDQLHFTGQARLSGLLFLREFKANNLFILLARRPCGGLVRLWRVDPV